MRTAEEGATAASQSAGLIVGKVDQPPLPDDPRMYTITMHLGFFVAQVSGMRSPGRIVELNVEPMFRRFTTRIYPPIGLNVIWPPREIFGTELLWEFANAQEDTPSWETASYR